MIRFLSVSFRVRLRLVFVRSYFRPLNHFYAITLRIVLNFVHDVVDEEDPAA